MQKPRVVNEDGMVECSRCHFPRPKTWFTKDKYSTLGIGYMCRVCRPKGNKLKVVDPDFKVVPPSQIKLLKRPAEKMEAGSWERVVRRASIATAREVVMVYVGKSYYSHNSAYVGILEAARRLKLKVTVQHGMTELYITSVHSTRVVLDT